MTLEEIISENKDAVDIGNPVNDITTSLTDMIAPFMWLSVSLAVAFILLQIISMLRRRKLEKALFDIQKSLHEMNERDKARNSSQTSTQPPRSRPENETIIARSSSEKEQA